MKIQLREDDSGVSEVVGTILILAMTVVLFSAVILWVSSIPTPVAQTRIDIQGTLLPVYNAQGQEIKDNITLLHRGGEALSPLTTVIYVTSQRGNNPATTDTLHLQLFRSNVVSPNGLIDGSDDTWNAGERWLYVNSTIRSTDRVTVTIVDLAKGTVVWTQQLTPPAGTRPPVFLNVWADRLPVTPTIDTPQSGTPFSIMAQVTDLDGDLDPASVYGQLTYYFGQPSCSQSYRMYDDGPGGGHGDMAAGDGVYTLFVTACMSSPSIQMDGSLVLFNATDRAGHTSTTRMVLRMVPGTEGTQGGGGSAGSGRPPNLRWNGNQGYNIFNATQWDQLGYAAKETRTFKAGETVVIVVGSLTLENTFGINTFSLWDPYSGNPQQAVVYGATKTVTQSSIPSSTQAFSFFQFVNGYYVYTYRFKMNDASVGINFYSQPPQYPRYYYFAKYPLTILLTSSTGNRFTTTDSINITSDTGGQRSFPIITTYGDASFSTLKSSFKSTDIMYVQVKMFTVDSNSSMGNVAFGNVIIQDFSGGAQLWRAPIGGTQANLPICPPVGACSGQAIWSVQVQNVYRFSINLGRVNQDPWVAGTQNYAFSIASIKDSDETYGSVTTQIIVTAPLYRMDVLAGVSEATNNAWGTKNYVYYFENFNGLDIWKPQRVDYCANAGISISGVQGQGVNCPTTNNVRVVYGDFNMDGTLDLAESFIAQQGDPASMFVIYRRGIDAEGNIVYLPQFFDRTGSTACTALGRGDVTGDGAPDVVCGASNGWVWYYRNDGNWTKVYVDQSRTQSINTVAVADFNGDGWNDIAVGGASGRLTWYANLDGLGRFQNTGISDNWFAVAEQTLNGTIAQNSYLATYVQDSVYEQLQEGLRNVPLQTGSTVNPDFDANTNNWTFAAIQGTATGTRSATGGNPNGYVNVQTSFQANTKVAGYWWQAFTTSGSPPYTATLTLDWRILTYNAPSGGSVAFYAYVDTTSAAPPVTPAPGQYVWTSGTITGTTNWATISPVDVSTKITAPGTYYLKIEMVTTYAGSGGTTTGGIDNIQITWSSTPGQTSALEHYWRLNTLPNRAGTAFTFYFRAHMSASTDTDIFSVYYATNVVGNDPTTGTYALLLNVTSTTDTLFTVPLPAGVQGKTVWIKAVDSNRYVGNTALDSLYVDLMYVNANTPSGPTGVSLANPNDSSAVNSINAQDANGDGISDLAVATANGHVFKYLGSSGGLQTPSACHYSNAASGQCTAAGTSIVGVRWGNLSDAYPGLEIVIAYGTTIRVLRGDVANTVITSNLPAYSPSSSLTALAVGDVNGDGPDDVVVGTSGGVIFFWANLNAGVSWTAAITIYNVGAQVYSLVIGDGSNAQYVGR